MGVRRNNLVVSHKKPSQENHYHVQSYHNRFEYVAGNLQIATNLALLHFMWMLVSGALLPNQGALFPALKATGLSDAATRRAWAAFRKGV